MPFLWVWSEHCAVSTRGICVQFLILGHKGRKDTTSKVEGRLSEVLAGCLSGEQYGPSRCTGLFMKHCGAPAATHTLACQLQVWGRSS